MEKRVWTCAAWVPCQFCIRHFITCLREEQHISAPAWLYILCREVGLSASSYKASQCHSLLSGWHSRALCQGCVALCAAETRGWGCSRASTIPVSADSKDRPHKPACAKEQQAHRQALNAHAQLVWSNIDTHTHMHNKDPGWFDFLIYFATDFS